jgi:predicted transcriptional regulator
MARPPSTQPTDGELEILKVLWELGPAGLGQVHSAMQAHRAVALTTVATMLKMMLAKGLVSRRDGDRGYEWSARISRKVAVSGLIGKLVQHVFDGSARRLVAHLLQEGDIGDRERAEILELLKQSAVEQSRAKPKRKGGAR